jgi:hypothetical protein
MGKYDDDDVEAPEVNDEVEDTEEEAEDTGFDEKAARRTISRGWGRAEQVKAASSAFAERLKPEKTPQLIKFLEDEPYTSYRYHWMDGREGQKSFTCIDDIDPKGCPLCSAGSRASSRFAFNVALFVDGDWVNKSYEGGPRVMDALKNFHNDNVMGPLTKGYWSVFTAGKKGSSSTNHAPVKARDLEEDWSAEEPDDNTLKMLDKGKYDASIVFFPKRTTLVEVAAEELGD